MELTIGDSEWYNEGECQGMNYYCEMIERTLPFIVKSIIPQC